MESFSLLTDDAGIDALVEAIGAAQKELTNRKRLPRGRTVWEVLQALDRLETIRGQLTRERTRRRALELDKLVDVAFGVDVGPRAVVGDLTNGVG